MRVLLARFSVLSLCVLAVSVVPARGQSPSLMSAPALVDTGTNNSDSDSGVASNKSFENTAAAYPLLVGMPGRINSKLAAGASQNPPVAGAGQTPPPSAGAGQTPSPATGTGPDQSVTANIGSHLKIFGAVRLDVYYNSARTQGPGLPAFLVPKFVGGFSQRAIAINARNSTIGVLFTGPDLGKFHSGGRLSAVFFDNTNVFADNNGILLTQAYGELFNDQWRFAAGLQLDVFAPNLPTVLPFSADGAPVGNTIKGQIRVERFVPAGSASQWTFQAAASEPLNSIKTPDVSLDEDNGWPNVEGRIAFGGGKPAPIGIGLLTQRPIEIGVSGLVGQLRRTALPSDPARRVVSDVFGINLDFRVNLAGRYGFKGEVYTGQGLGQSAGAILQSLDAVTWKAIRSTGGWIEGFVYLKPNLHSHTGILIDEPNANDITAIPNTLFGRTYNRTFYSTLLWDIGKTFRIGIEPTWRKTEYKEPTNLPNEGFGLQTQFAWTF
jgi:hypothetical protein